MRAGRRYRTSRLDFYSGPNAVGHPRFGVVVPRYGNSAVARNRVQRRLREGIRRTLLVQLSGTDLVVRARPASYGAGWPRLVQDLAEWLKASTDWS